jgi:trimeric autotransporter adhesin
MKTKIYSLKTFLALIVLIIFGIYHVKGQPSAYSGIQDPADNNPGPNAAGIVGTNFGTFAGQNNANTDFTGIGHLAGQYSVNGFNTFVGCASGQFFTSDLNTAIGTNSLRGTLNQSTGGENTAIGFDALEFNTVGEGNTGAGSYALSNNSVGNHNSAFGMHSLISNTGSSNCGFGYLSLLNNTGGSFNTAVGNQALSGTAGQACNSNTAVGDRCLRSITTGHDNTAVGGTSALILLTDGHDNVAVGSNALGINVQGHFGTAIGSSAMLRNVIVGINANVAVGYQSLMGTAGSNGNYNTATGYQTLMNNTTGHGNTSDGIHTLFSNTTGAGNSSVGDSALFSNTTGIGNTAVGFRALYSNTTAGEDLITSTSYGNTAVGFRSLFNNTTGNGNVANGSRSLVSNTTGGKNVAIGTIALQANTQGAVNCAVGYQALNSNTTGSYNTALGVNSLITNATGTYNSALGYGADVSSNNLSNVTAVGYNVVASASDRMYFGNATVQGCYNTTGVWTSSDGRFKINVNENVTGLNFINNLRPVTYQLDTKALDDFLIQNMPDSLKAIHQAGMDFTPSTTTIHSGFIAQEVELAATTSNFVSSIVSRPNNNTDVYALNYAEIVVPLVKAVQELSKTIDSIKSIQKKSDSINTAIINGLMNHQLATDNLLNTLINCCAQNPTNKTKQNTGDSSNNSIITYNIELANNAILYQNAPNPFGAGTTIKYFVPDNTDARIIFYDEFGDQLKIFTISEKGMGEIKIEASNLSTGMYSYSLFVNGKLVDTKKMIKE